MNNPHNSNSLSTPIFEIQIEPIKNKSKECYINLVKKSFSDSNYEMKEDDNTIVDINEIPFFNENLKQLEEIENELIFSKSFISDKCKQADFFDVFSKPNLSEMNLFEEMNLEKNKVEIKFEEGLSPYKMTNDESIESLFSINKLKEGKYIHQNYIENHKNILCCQNKEVNKKFSEIEFDPKKLVCKDKIETSDLILTLIYVYNNSCKYDHKYSRKSNIFWSNILRITEFKKIFKDYKYDTLKKYSNFIQKLNFPQDFLVEHITQNSRLLNTNSLRFLNIIKILKNFSEGNSTLNEAIIDKLNKNKNENKCMCKCDCHKMTTNKKIL